MLLSDATLQSSHVLDLSYCLMYLVFSIEEQGCSGLIHGQFWPSLVINNSLQVLKSNECSCLSSYFGGEQYHNLFVYNDVASE